MTHDRRPWVPGGLLTVGCILTLGVNQQRSVPLLQPLDSIPLTLAGQVGIADTISDEQRLAAGMTSYLFRYYEQTTSLLTVYVGYYDRQTQGKTIHSPRNCLPGSGWETLQQTQIPLTTTMGTVLVNRSLQQKGNQRALVLYWYQGRGRIAAGEYRVKWELLRDAALRGRTEEALVRVVVYLQPGASEPDASASAELAAAGLAEEVAKVLPSW
jgi:EpsI family protein